MSAKPTLLERCTTETEKSSDRLQETLETVFRLKSFRHPQREVIEALLHRQDTFLLMPTGGGKSLCYMIPAVLSDGVTLVVSPLIALMHDQVERCKSLGIPARVWSSSAKDSEKDGILSDLRHTKPSIRLLYITP